MRRELGHDDLFLCGRLGRSFQVRLDVRKEGRPAAERTTRLTSLPVLTAPAPLKVSALPEPGAWAWAWDGTVDRAFDTLLH